MMKTLLSNHCRRWYANTTLLCFCIIGTATTSHASDEVLTQGAGVRITSEQAQIELLSLPPEIRANILSDAKVLREWLDTIYLRKVLAAQAEANNLGKKSAVQYQLQSTRESILANAQLHEVEDAALPSIAALEAQARAQYTAERERFNLPAQTRASHILVKGNDDAARIKAQQLLDQLKAGTPFEELARKHSDDSGSAPQGGNLGWFASGRMVAEVDAAIEQLKTPGDLSPVVKSQFGFHVIRLDERKPAHLQPFESVRDQLIAPIVHKLRAQTRETEFKRVGDMASTDARAIDAFRDRENQRLPGSDGTSTPQQR